jgi:hypothetical protein
MATEGCMSGVSRASGRICTIQETIECKWRSKAHSHAGSEQWVISPVHGPFVRSEISTKALISSQRKDRVRSTIPPQLQVWILRSPAKVRRGLWLALSHNGYHTPRQCLSPSLRLSISVLVPREVHLVSCSTRICHSIGRLPSSFDFL